MILTLPTEHPPLKGCLNLLNTKQLMGYDFDAWEMTEEDTFIIVDYMTKMTDSDWQFAKTMNDVLDHKRYKPPVATYLPVEIQEWFNNSDLKGEWFYDVRSDYRAPPTSVQRIIRLCFQFASDALVFKLTWGGGQE